MTNYNRVAVIRARNGLLGSYKRDRQRRGAMRSSEGDDVGEIVMVEIKSACWVCQINNVNVVFLPFKIST